MHCVKTVNVEYKYGNTRIFLLATITFFVVFCLSYVLTSYKYPSPHKSDYLPLFMFTVFLIYPIHKLIHIFPLITRLKNMKFNIRLKFHFIPVLHVSFLTLINKNLYMFALALPAIFLNTLLLVSAFILPEYAHYFCLLLAYHCSICLIDILFLLNIFKSPKSSLIEETDKGYEILVPTGKI